VEEKVFYRNQLVNDINIYYEFYPNPNSEKTLVLLHGFLSSTFSYRRLIPLLNKEYQVVSIDLPPFGKSGKSNNFIYSYRNLAQTVIQLISTLGLKKLLLSVIQWADKLFSIYASTAVAKGSPALQFILFQTFNKH
jgi:alpha-beta hydrolase superfamily lysophospholipase